MFDPMPDMTRTMPRVRPPSPHDRLAELFEAHHTAVLGYATRRAASPEQAADVFSEVFLVAWRRLDDVPPGDEAKLWLFGVARRALANARRASRRHDRLVERLAATLPANAFVTPPPDVAPAGRIRAAIDRLGATDAELVRLVAWEGLTPREAAPVLGLSPELTRVRLHRARARLRDLLADAEPPQRDGRDGHGTDRRAPARLVEEEVR